MRPLPLCAYSSTEQLVLVAIKHAGEATVAALSKELDLAEASVRGPLSLLEASGLLRYRLVGEGTGRRKHLYSLTEAGNRVFPDRSSELWSQLLAHVENHIPEVLSEFWQTRMKNWAPIMARELPRPDDPEAPAKIEAAFNRQDFVTEVTEAEGAIAVRVVHCPYLELAKQQPVVCELERAALAVSMPGAIVTREEHQVTGDRNCVYRIAR